jgi:two-component system, NtrC family, nitrogen regulation sensor histidine kinase NtrY
VEPHSHRPAPGAPQKSKPRLVGLQVKVIALLLVVALTPLLAAALLIDRIAEVAQNFASHEADTLRRPLERAGEVYPRLIDAKKRSYQQMADQLVGSVALEAALGGAPEQLAAAAEHLLAAEPDLLRIEVRGADGAALLDRSRPGPGPGGPAAFRPYLVEAEAAGGGRVALELAADVALLDTHRALLRVLEDTARVGGQVRGALPRSYRLGFLVLLGGMVLMATLGGFFLARRYTRRIADLVAGTRRVAGGDLAARVALDGRDELSELASAFNRMVEDLQQDRQQILYLQRIGAWQDVARRLAHEIKNPLTPIQLAVQQLVSSYQGDDVRHRKMLDEAAEIVGEEIASLRRLVDAFSALGRLPPAEPRPIDLAVVADDLSKDPMFAGALDIEAPEEPVTVAGDRLLLRRLLANLVENGIHASERGSGRVQLSWSADPHDGRARVTVDDEGPGVAQDRQEKIFEPYVTSKETGTGLGLAIAKKSALDHRGDLAIATERGPLGGARFVLTLPLAGGEDGPERARRRPGARTPRRRARSVRPARSRPAW